MRRKRGKSLFPPQSSISPSISRLPLRVKRRRKTRAASGSEKACHLCRRLFFVEHLEHVSFSHQQTRRLPRWFDGVRRRFQRARRRPRRHHHGRRRRPKRKGKDFLTATSTTGLGRVRLGVKYSTTFWTRPPRKLVSPSPPSVSAVSFSLPGVPFAVFWG